MMKTSSSRLVYSTETGRLCPDCQQVQAQCSCKAQARAARTGDGNVTVSRDSKGRGGKCVTLIKGVALDALALAQLGKQLRAACGSGGTVKDGVIEIQGNHCDLVMATLVKLGQQPKRSGA